MRDRGGVAPLTDLADLVLQHRLQALRAAADARAATAARIAGLAETATTEVDPLLVARLSMQYQRWADTRRAALNLVLARQTADWLTAQARAAEAFGRASVLGRLAERSRR